MKANFFALLAFLAALSNSAAARQAFGGADEVITAQSLQFGDVSKDGQARVRSILAKEGLIAISSVPGLAHARQEALVAAAQCVLAHGESAAPLVADMVDSSKRSTWAARVNANGDKVAASAQCPEVQEKMEELRSIMDAASMYFVRLLDNSVRTEYDLGLLPKKDGGVYHTFDQLVSNANHLDHFHVYEKRGASNDLALDLHTDQGLFIGIVPSIRVSAHGEINKEEDSFMVQLNNNAIARVKLPASGDVILFMIGDGSNFLSPESHSGLRAVPHALNLAVTPEKTVRAWFGRMFFAPNDALLGGTKESFESIINSLVEARRLGMQAPTLGCSKSANPFERRILDMGMASPEDCTATEHFCWMLCLSTTSMPCAHEDVICQTPDGKIYNNSCTDCHQGSLACVTGAPTLAPNTTAPTSGAQVSSMGTLLMSVVLAALGSVVMG